MAPDAGPPPLSGVTVIEIGNFLAAPFAAAQLADLGAQVIKVESPQGGDAVRSVGPFLTGMSSSFLGINRNKQSVALDLGTAGGLAAGRTLIERADVLIENRRPGAMDQPGFGYDELRPRNPRLIYASATGWGRICDLVSALYLALGIVAALRVRDRDGTGQAVEVSLYESGVSFAVWEAGKFFATGEAAAPQGSAHQSLAPYQAIATRDGHITIGAVTPKTWSGFCAVLGLAEVTADTRFATASSVRLSRTPVRHGPAGPTLGGDTRATLTAAGLVTTRDAQVLTVTFNRPHRRNALTWEMYDGLVAALDDGERDPGIRALVLRDLIDLIHRAQWTGQ